MFKVIALYVVAIVMVAGVAGAQQQLNSQDSPAMPATTSTDEGPSRLTVTVSLTGPEDLKVAQEDLEARIAEVEIQQGQTVRELEVLCNVEETGSAAAAAGGGKPLWPHGGGNLCADGGYPGRDTPDVSNGRGRLRLPLRALQWRLSQWSPAGRR